MSRKVSVFLSYRRADAPYAAGRLADRLGERFGLFMDIDIAPGLHFGHALTEAVSSCDAMLVLIGRSWLDAMDDDGRRRLEDPRDWVVQEIEAALARDVIVIPVLVDGARMPTPAELPPRAGVTRLPSGDQPAPRVVHHRHRHPHHRHRAGRADRPRCRHRTGPRPQCGAVAGERVAPAAG